MKKLKKGLSLVLVLVMVFGLATNAFAWDTTYADNDQITYKEAVEAMSGMGIIDGKLDNLFDPAGNYTREEAAKVITYMLLGPETAEVIKPSSTSFSDVDAGRWSAGYISYAAAQDIIVGWDGEFHPEDSLTRAQWLKMLLVALGYDPIEKGLEDNLNWETNALTLAIQIGLIDSKEATATFNRELAIQYAFNALNTPTVNKWGKPGDILGKSIFQLESFKDVDEYGRPVNGWKNTDTEEVYAENHAEPVLYYSDKSVDVEDAEEAISDKAEITVVIENGVQTYPADDATKPETIGGKSTEVEIYETGENTYTAVVVKLMSKALTADDVKDIKAFADFEEGDVVTYNESSEGISNVTKLEGVEGKVTATGTGYIRVDGEKVTAAWDYSVVNNGEAATLVYGDTGVFYYDAYGNYVYVDITEKEPEERQPDGYAYIIATETVIEKGSTGSLINQPVEGSAVAVAKIVNLTEGTVDIVDRAMVYDKETAGWYFADKNGNKTGNAQESKYYEWTISGGLNAYYVLDDGNYVFESVTNNAYTITKGQAKLDSNYITDSTVLKVIGAELNEDDTKIVDIKSVNTYTGLTNFPDTTTGNGVVLAENGKVTEIILVTEATEVPPVEKTTYAVFDKTGEHDEAGYHNYFFLADGTQVDYVTKDAYVSFTAKDVVTLTYTDGEITGAAKEEADKSGKVTMSTSTYVAVDGDAVDFAKEYDVYGGELKVGAEVQVFLNSDNYAEFIYVTKAAE